VLPPSDKLSHNSHNTYLALIFGQWWRGLTVVVAIHLLVLAIACISNTVIGHIGWRVVGLVEWCRGRILGIVVLVMVYVPCLGWGWGWGLLW
jgi:hypothetical protein